ncbi:MAG: hypothetical protein PWP75_708 [Caldanaerobacter sp.]|uniref:Uncharacterized protein n=1 Tax=Caldanaerobacter subterraneus subsp. pacificus DSM 12653 TaxID=391606 RepID=A0A0F5PJT3_9THEO|nr:hypothetical protein [Caldanaerobacter subterraneus]KKC28880.1 hypothetical protein CDSM653_02104 [Caldanaerobacter subterraneus subsp. pacificus DSM 12653]MDK2794079.1 hypothetical protein [Caldanaerobacter sp.]
MGFLALIIALSITSIVFLIAIILEVTKLQAQSKAFSKLNQETQEKLSSLRQKAESIEKLLENIE